MRNSDSIDGANGTEEVGDDVPGFSDELDSLFGNDSDIRRHVFDGVHHRLRTRSTLGVMTGLLSIGFETMGELLNDPHRNADRKPQGQ